MRIEAITFDVGGTLLEPWPSVGEVYGKAALECGLGEFKPEVISENFFRTWTKRGHFDYSRPSWRKLVNQSFEGLCHVSDELFERIYQEFAKAGAWRVFEDVLPALAALKDGGLKLGVISNWDERLRPLLAEIDLERFFEVITVSSEVGAHKPEPEIFRAAAEALGVNPMRIVHVGDSDLEDISGAKLAGFEALKISRQRPGDARGIRSLLELAGFIER